jgi:hypothetical protein
MISAISDLPREPFSVAVVMTTMLSETLLRAVDSVFAQDVAGSAQLLIGVNGGPGDRAMLEEIRGRCPAAWRVSVFDPGYSTAVQQGGLYAAADGALRTVLSYAAHSRYVAYLEERHWWARDHLSSLLEAVSGQQWAYSQRWFVDAETLEPLGVDAWESVGPGAGVFKNQFGGFVDASSLLVDKVACEPSLRWWTVPLPADKQGRSADRNVFAHLRRHYRSRGTNRATCYFRLDPADPMHGSRMKALARKAPEKAAAAGPQAAAPLPII